jgi:hypothetical protein
MRGTFSCAVAASLGAAHLLFAQLVSGTAHVSGADVPLGGAAVVLVNQNGVIVAGTLTGADGRYTIRAPIPGQYRVRARHIGFAPDSAADIRLETTSQARYDPSLTSLRTSLQVVRVEGIQKCEVGPESGEAAYELWDAAQNTLAATIAAAGDRVYTYRLARFLRVVEPGTRNIVHGTTTRLRAHTSEPYYSADPDSLVKVGFARTQGDSTAFYAPDAKTLTSEAFIRTHCLRAEKDTARPGQLGLAFEPVRKSNVVDVSGALWLDRASSELRDLDYRYEMPDQVIRGRRYKRAGPLATGHIEYRKLDNGAWIVDSWVIQVPIQSSPASYATNRADPNNGVTALWEVGGNVAGVLNTGDTTIIAEDVLGSIAGRLVSGPTKLPVVGAQLGLIPASPLYHPRTQRTIAGGVFSFDSLPPDTWVLRVADIELDTLNIAFPEIPFQVQPGTSHSTTITMPSPAEGRELLCKGGSDPKSIIVHGTVTDSVLGLPFPRAHVAATWMEETDSDKPRVAREKEVIADKNGKFAFCDLKSNTQVTVGAAAGDLHSQSVFPLKLLEGGIYMVNLRLAPLRQ